MKCQKCGTEFEGNFCSNCGFSFVVEKAKEELRQEGARNVENQNVSICEKESTAIPQLQITPSAEQIEQQKSDLKIKIISTLIALVLIIGIPAVIIIFSGGKTAKETEQKPNFGMNMTAAETTMEDYLKSPSTAEYSYYDEDWKFYTEDNKKVKISSFVDSQNSFGAVIRNNFVITITYTDDYKSFKINEVEIDGVKYK